MNCKFVEQNSNDLEDEYFEFEKRAKCSIITEDSVKVEIGDKSDYKQLAKYHYKSGALPIVKNFYTLKLNGDLIGVLVAAFSGIASRGRNKIFEGFNKPCAESMRRLNNEFETVSRIIIHPKFRSVGLAYYFLEEYFKLTPHKTIEALAVMANYNPFFERAGFVRVEVAMEEDVVYYKLVKPLKEIDIDLKLVSSIKYVKEKYELLDQNGKDIFIKVYKDLINKYNGIVGFRIKEFDIDFDDKEFCRTFKKLFKKDVVYLYKENPYFIPVIKKPRIFRRKQKPER